jgi:hypothetical protein
LGPIIMGISPAVIAVTVLLPPRTQIGSCAATFRANSNVFSKPQAGTKAAISVGRMSAANFLPLYSGLRISSQSLGSLSAGTRFLL